MIVRNAVLALALAALAGCGGPVSDDQPGTAKLDSEGRRQSSLTSNAQPTPAAPVSTRRSTLVSIAQLRSELGAQETGRGLLVALPNDVLFDFDKADLRTDSAATLDKVATLARSQAGPIAIEGHSDAKGDDAYNLALSKRRADAVAAALAARGVEATRLSATGLGETRPVAPNATASGADDPAGRQRNRRVDVILPKPTG